MRKPGMQLVRLLPPLDPGKPGDGGIVRDGSIVRDVAAKRAVTLGGLPAVLLQLAHPMVAQGVSDYSDIERDPLARMISTLDATLVAKAAARVVVAGSSGSEP